MTATAFMCVYNESDIVAYTIRHLIEQGVGVHVVDNWSSDGSAEIVREFPLAGYERFPADGPSRWYSWTTLLRRVEELAFRSTSDWCVHHDADEIRRSPRPGESLLDGFARVQGAGHNAVNFHAYHFIPVDDLYGGDPERHFRFYQEDHLDGRMRQVKAWRNTGRRVDLASTGGHFAKFPGIAVCPEKFILKHYPLRCSEQAARKVLTERLGRYDPEDLARGFHVQYDEIGRTRRWLRDPGTLREWRDGQVPPTFVR